MLTSDAMAAAEQQARYRRDIGELQTIYRRDLGEI